MPPNRRPAAKDVRRQFQKRAKAFDCRLGLVERTTGVAADIEPDDARLCGALEAVIAFLRLRGRGAAVGKARPIVFKRILALPALDAVLAGKALAIATAYELKVVLHAVNDRHQEEVDRLFRHR